MSRLRGVPLWILLCLATACSPLAVAHSRSFIAPLNRVEFSSRGLLKGARNSTLSLHGSVRDAGYFYAGVWLGQPPRRYALIVDTGSTVTYVPCSSCSQCGHHKDPPYDPNASRTSSYVACKSPDCSCGSPACSCPDSSTCQYERHYAEKSSSVGLLVRDNLHLLDGAEAVPVVFGCESLETGDIFAQTADGLLGLGMSSISFPAQLHAAGITENQFSLCLGGVHGGGALFLGAEPLPPGAAMVFTPLQPSESHPYYFRVRLEDVHLNGTSLGQSAQTYSGTARSAYGVVLDSGTTFSYFPDAAHAKFLEVVTAVALESGLQSVPGPDQRFPDVCFYREGLEIEDLPDVFPDMTLIFKGGAGGDGGGGEQEGDSEEPAPSLRLPPINYLFMHATKAGGFCVGVFRNRKQGTLLGGITFRDVLIRFDRDRGRVGLANVDCAPIGEERAGRLERGA